MCTQPTGATTVKAPPWPLTWASGWSMRVHMGAQAAARRPHSASTARRARRFISLCWRRNGADFLVDPVQVLADVGLVAGAGGDLHVLIQHPVCAGQVLAAVEQQAQAPVTGGEARVRGEGLAVARLGPGLVLGLGLAPQAVGLRQVVAAAGAEAGLRILLGELQDQALVAGQAQFGLHPGRSEEHTSELQSPW